MTGFHPAASQQDMSARMMLGLTDYRGKSAHPDASLPRCSPHRIDISKRSCEPDGSNPEDYLVFVLQEKRATTMFDLLPCHFDDGASAKGFLREHSWWLSLSLG